MKDQVVLRIITKLLVPYMLVFGVYVIAHGELGPGGGFQGGVILAAGFILYGLVWGKEELHRFVPRRVTDLLAAGGVLLYSGVGVATMALGGRFLDYSMFNADNKGDGEALGMLLIEYGVGITVCTVMITIYDMISEPEDVA
ncbi:MAG: Na(+)/H(+) antiporter subunit B [Planctomycetota bacterium]|jgi:multicomponent Na+:H+ antiporter subunit B|nr:Na(+)/H(+) antiporter subunit B [Planctomycetota bacterium]